MLRFLLDSGWGRLGKEKEQFHGKTFSDLNFAKNSKRWANSMTKRITGLLLCDINYLKVFKSIWLLQAYNIEDSYLWFAWFRHEIDQKIVLHYFSTVCWRQKWTFLIAPKKRDLSKSKKSVFPAISMACIFSNWDIFVIPLKQILFKLRQSSQVHNRNSLHGNKR